MKKALNRVARFDKRTEKIFFSVQDKLFVLLPRIKTRGLGIVEPQHLFEDIKAIMNDCTAQLTKEDFKEILPSIREIVVLPFGVAFALNPAEEDWEYILVIDESLDVETLAHADYSNFRRESMNVSEGTGEILLHEKEISQVGKQHAENLSARSRSHSKSQGKIMKH
ncbi:sucrose synthase [Ranunculus cassubicifolius]